VNSALGLELGRVKFLVEKSAAVVSEAVKSLSPCWPLNETVVRKLRQSDAGVAAAGDPKIVERLWGEISFVPKSLHNTLVYGAHPVRSLPDHIAAGVSRCHMFTDTSILESNTYSIDGIAFVNDCIPLAKF